MKEFLEKHGIRVLLIAAALAAALFAMSRFQTTSVFLRNAAGVIASPFRLAATGIESWVADKQRYYADTRALEAENEALRHEIADLQRKIRRAEADSEENVRLRQLLELKEQRSDFTFASGAVIERSTSNWCSTLTLDCGSEDGILPGNCVITAEGELVGIVDEAGLGWCTVNTVIDTDTELGARVFRTGEVVVAEGDFTLMGQGRLKLAYLPVSPTFVAGDYVVTSGLGGSYPADLVLGTVESIRTDRGQDSYAVVAPTVDFDALSQLFVITAYEIVN